MGSTIDISWGQLALFMSVLFIPLLINRRFELRLGRDISIAVIRMTVQLILVGLYLEFLFELNSPLLNILWLSVMILIGASAIIGGVKLPKRVLYLPVFTGLIIAITPLMLILLALLLKPQPIFSAQYTIPLAGMLLGNSLSGNIVALQRLFSAFEEKRMEYEGVLALGGKPNQAAYPFVQSALKQSLAPILASMTTTGLVTLPGMMTGQILGGSDPMVAIKYQLVILVAIFVMLSVSVTISLVLSVRSSIEPTGFIKIRINKP
ncbi:putative ABC transport system permease protein [Shewanella sediminis HAW-EB3]|uniref:Putative ABC transport system permease protein n=1 Tax=Shewanella sediminis (strain HAW-EB3) TaxID=425104 RepID=A8G010_SHESH|nr:ABC transporter permease [Shewanella sediminis]ABV38433.1 putative ABC transport system permease protein [Shewanella sediminis HAW-EB3]